MLKIGNWILGTKNWEQELVALSQYDAYDACDAYIMSNKYGKNG